MPCHGIEGKYVGTVVAQFGWRRYCDLPAVTAEQSGDPFCEHITTLLSAHCSFSFAAYLPERIGSELGLPDATSGFILTDVRVKRD